MTFLGPKPFKNFKIETYYFNHVKPVNLTNRTI